MVESTDKGLPLLRPTNFKDDDPINPKYSGKVICKKSKKKRRRK